MGLFQSTKSRLAAENAKRNSLDIQNQPAILTTTSKEALYMKVDGAYIVNDLLIVSGWRSTPLKIKLLTGGNELKFVEFKTSRGDVAAHLQQPDTLITGFYITAKIKPEQSPYVLIDDGDLKYQSLPLTCKNEIAEDELFSLPGSVIPLLLPRLNINEDQQQKLLAKCPVVNQTGQTASGFLEGANIFTHSKSVVIVGWAVHTPETIIWLEDDQGNTYPLEPQFRRYRKDVYDSMVGKFGHLSQNAAFIIKLDFETAPTQFKLKALSEQGIHQLHAINTNILPNDPVACARWLFAIETLPSEFHARTPKIDEPLLRPLIEERQANMDLLTPAIHHLGKAPSEPLVSIIIPLYGRIDFIEHQLMEFTKDEWLKANTEIIYVLDDPSLTAELTHQAEVLFRLYKLPFSWVGGDVNRGFSGANNLGARFAKGQYLNFLNSDAFPQKPNWLGTLIDSLSSNPNLGAIGPRLTFADGGIQHAGMEFIHKHELGIWINHHPNMGLDTLLDPNNELTVMPAITGACLVISRVDFDAIGHWDTGYLIGDFEDSDLCLKLRNIGKDIGYLPSVQLTHLERQSFKLLGKDDFRTKVVLFNALRHQQRWANLIEQPVEASHS